MHKFTGGRYTIRRKTEEKNWSTANGSGVDGKCFFHEKEPCPLTLGPPKSRIGGGDHAC